jgi:hypothetical protein
MSESVVVVLSPICGVLVSILEARPEPIPWDPEVRIQTSYASASAIAWGTTGSACSLATTGSELTRRLSVTTSEPSLVWLVPILWRNRFVLPCMSGIQRQKTVRLGS